MYLPRTAEYAMRVMVTISLEKGKSPLTAGRLASLTGIPHPFLSKILRRLVSHGLLLSHRGEGGGFVLARPAGGIRFIEILRAAEYPFEDKHCLFGWRRCGETHPCPLHSSWKAVKEGFQRWAEGTTLDQI